MSSNPVELSVRSQLKKVIEDLEAISNANRDVSKSLSDVGKEIGDTHSEQVKKTSTFLGNLRSMSGRVADQLRGDFRSLLSINALKDGLKLSEQFRGSIKEAVTLSDTIRKLGNVFGIASGDFTSFQTKMIRGLGEIGLGSEAAANTLSGLSETPVRGQENLVEYSKTAGELASVTRQKGQEGEIAKGISQVILARGGNVNDLGQMRGVAEDLRRVFNQTGKGPTDTLQAMQHMFAGMSKDFRKSLSTRALVNLAAASQVAGPNSTKFLEEYLSKSPIARKAFEAQGGKGIIGKNGIDVDKFAKFSQQILSRVGGDPRLAAQTLGLSEEAAEGFIRLSESLQKVRTAQDGIGKATGNLNDQYKSSMGLSEAFSANINRVKKFVAAPLAKASQGITDVLGGAAQSDMGAVATVAGGGVLAALLAGFGLKGIGKGIGGMGGGLVQGAAVEGLTGRQVQPVFVVNADQIGGGGLGAAAEAAASKSPLLSMLGKAGAVGLAGGAGYALGSKVINPLVESSTQGKTEDGFEGNAVERLIYSLEKLVGAQSAMQIQKAQRVIVELNKRDLKESKQPTRGASF